MKPVQYTRLSDMFSEVREYKHRGPIYVKWLMVSSSSATSAHNRLIVAVRAQIGAALHSYTSPIGEYEVSQAAPEDTPEDRQQKIALNMANFHAHSARAEAIVSDLMGVKVSQYTRMVRAVINLAHDQIIFGETMRPRSEVDAQAEQEIKNNGTA